MPAETVFEPYGVLDELSRLHAAPPLVENAKDGTLLVLTPGTDAVPDNAPGADPLGAFYLALHPVTNAQYKWFVDETGRRPPDEADWGKPVWRGQSFPPEKADHPVVCVTWDDAAAYAAWAGLALPREAEWFRAARGPAGASYPWGDSWGRHRCRHEDNLAGETTCSVWQYPEGASGWGHYHMAGNVFEWCVDPAPASASVVAPGGQRMDPALPRRAARGGSWHEDKHGCRCASAAYFEAVKRRGNVGFRVGRFDAR